MNKRIFAFVGLLLCFAAQPALATSINCKLKAMPEDFDSADLVISGKVISQETVEAPKNEYFTANVHSVFEVLDVWKGDVEKTVNISSQSVNGMNFGQPFKLGSSYLVFARKDKNGSFTSQINSCNYTMPIENASTYIADLKHFKETHQHFSPSCTDNSFEDKMEQADIVALGSIESVNVLDTQGTLFDGEIKFNPKKVWKGNPPKSFTVLTLGKRWQNPNFYKEILNNLNKPGYILFAKQVKQSNQDVHYEQSDCWGLFQNIGSKQAVSRDSEEVIPLHSIRKYFGEHIPECNGDTDINTALMRGESSKIRCFLSSAKEIKPSQEWFVDALEQAVSSCEVEATEELIALKANINHPYSHLMTSAINCADFLPLTKQTTALVQILLEAKLDIDVAKYIDIVNKRSEHVAQMESDRVCLNSVQCESVSVYKPSALHNLDIVLKLLKNTQAH